MQNQTASENKRGIWAWAFYDWAISAFHTTVVAGFFPVFFKAYYSAGADATVSTAQLGVANAVASLLIGMTAPLLGAVADLGGYKKLLLFLFTFLAALATALLTWVGSGHWQLAVGVYVVASALAASANAFYDSLLPEVAAPQDLHRVSALGFALGYLGGGLLFAVQVFAYLNPSAFGLRSGVLAVKLSFLSVGVWWLLFTIPLLLYVREPASRVRGLKLAGASVKQFWRTLLEMRGYRNVLLFLAAYFLYNDGVGTTIKMAVDYGLSLGFAAGDLITALLIVQFVGFPAALLFGRLTHRFSPRAAVLGGLGVYLICIVWASRMQSTKEFFAIAMLIGLVQGGVQSVSRSLFALLIPSGRSGEFFGFFNLLGRFAGLLGPLLIAGVGLLTGASRLGILSISVLFFVGGALLMRVQVPKTNVYH